MRLLLSKSRRQIQILLAAGLVAAAGVVAGPAIAAQAQDCAGSSCNGLNSNAEGCVSDAVSRSAPATFFSTAAGEQLAIQLRGSPSCESRWARVWAINSSGSQLPPPLGLDFTIYSDNASGQVVYAQTATAGDRGWESYPYWVGPMVSGVGLYSRACIQNGACTSWWPSAPPNSAQPENEMTACVFNAPTGALTLGHVGWAFQLPQDNWWYGADEGPDYLGPGATLSDASRTWYGVDASSDLGGLHPDVIATFADALGRNGVADYYHAAGYYTTYRCVGFVLPEATAMKDTAAAESVARHEQGQLYAIPGQDCESQVYNILWAYGDHHLPSDLVFVRPNVWYSLLGSYGFDAPSPLR